MSTSLNVTDTIWRERSLNQLEDKWRDSVRGKFKTQVIIWKELHLTTIWGWNLAKKTDTVSSSSELIEPCLHLVNIDPILLHHMLLQLRHPEPGRIPHRRLQLLKHFVHLARPAAAHRALHAELEEHLPERVLLGPHEDVVHMRAFLEELELVKQRRRAFVALFGLAEEVVVVVVVVGRGGFRALGCEIGVSDRPATPALDAGSPQDVQWRSAS
ncbi:hypothetical protein B0H14DRAFT_3656842 [Mycena olivaceomarginata]|nr:hypothetical protein B0H14DRAFT_3656842 [Mycena olivaceomarginata]